MNNESCPQEIPVRDEIAPAAHRLRSRLLTISAAAAHLTGSEDLTARKAGERIKKESKALTEELDQLITLSRVNEGYLPVTPEPLPVIDLIEDTMDRYSMAGTERGIMITLDEDAPDIYVLGTEDLLEDILDNLLSNAIRYCNEKIRISVEDAGEMVTVRVADDGPGIREEDLPHLFERFFIGKDGNFGLGLPIARSAAEKMGGTLTAANGPEGGAVFTVRLPACSRSGVYPPPRKNQNNSNDTQLNTQAAPPGAACFLCFSARSFLLILGFLLAVRVEMCCTGIIRSPEATRRSQRVLRFGRGIRDAVCGFYYLRKGSLT